MEIINLTPFTVRILDEENQIVEIAPSGRVAQLDIESNELAKMSSEGIIFSVKRLTQRRVIGLPDAQLGVTLLVSEIVADTVRDRADLVSLGELVVNNDGSILAKGLRSFLPEELTDKWYQHMCEI